MPKFFLLLVITGLTIPSFAQLQGQPLIDSLTAQLPKAKEDTNKVMLLNDLSLTYYSINPDEGLKFGKQGLALAEKPDWEKGKSYAYKVIAGNYGYGKSDYAQALDYAFRSLEQFKEIGDEMGTAKILGDIGVVYWFQSDYPKALNYYFDALRIHEKLGVKNEIAATLGNIGIIYNNQGDYRKALDYIVKVNKIDEELGNRSGVAANLANIGEVYRSLSDTAKALEYHLKSLRLCEELGDKNGIARNLGSLGIIYHEKGEYNQSFDFLFKALRLNEELGNKYGIAAILAVIGNSYLAIAKDSSDGRFLHHKTGALQQAKVYIERAVKMASEIGDLNSSLNNYKRLSEIQKLLGDNKNALASFENYAVLKDSVFNLEKNKKLTETAMQYEFDKKKRPPPKPSRKRKISFNAIFAVPSLPEQPCCYWC